MSIYDAAPASGNSEPTNADVLHTGDDRRDDGFVLLQQALDRSRLAIRNNLARTIITEFPKVDANDISKESVLPVMKALYPSAPWRRFVGFTLQARFIQQPDKLQPEAYYHLNAHFKNERPPLLPFALECDTASGSFSMFQGVLSGFVELGEETSNSIAHHLFASLRETPRTFAP